MPRVCNPLAIKTNQNKLPIGCFVNRDLIYTRTYRTQANKKLVSMPTMHKIHKMRSRMLALLPGTSFQ